MTKGRPTKYKPEYAKQAEKLCTLGATDVELAQAFSVSLSTLNEWKLKNAEFSLALQSVRDQGLSCMVKKLRALGATEDEVSEFIARSPSEDEWLVECLKVIRQDRRGVIAAQKRRRSQRSKSRYRKEPALRVVEATRARIWAALKGRSDGALFSRLGYGRSDLISHLEAQFRPGMSWENYGAWHIDHIRPCASYDQTDPEQFAECWSLDNLQPLWARENMAKGARYG